MFGIAGHAGNDDAVISCSENGKAIRAIVQIFRERRSRHQRRGMDDQPGDLPPVSLAATSDTNHLVVDGAYFYSQSSELASMATTP